MQLQLESYGGEILVKNHLADPSLSLFVLWWAEPQIHQAHTHWAGASEAGGVGNMGRWFKAWIVGWDKEKGVLKVGWPESYRPTLCKAL